MRRSARRLHPEPRHALARGDDLAALARRLRHQHVLRLLRLRLDRGARDGTADLLVRYVEDRHRQAALPALPDQVLERVECQEGAALHVVDAWPEDLVALAAEAVAAERADRMHGVEVAQQEAARLVAPPGRSRPEDVPLTIPPPRPLDTQAERIPTCPRS